MKHDIRALLRPLIPDAVLNLRRRQLPNNSSFQFQGPRDITAALRDEYGYVGDLGKIFEEGSGGQTHKWHHYIPLYERYLSGYRGKEIRLLEIGVGGGGGLRMWRKYFGAAAIIHGIDIEPACAAHATATEQVSIASQADLPALDAIIAEMGGVDIVLDDGSHQMSDIRRTFDHLFPRLNPGGMYVVEDLHTAYWRHYGGTTHATNNFFGHLLGVVDQMHHWYQPPIRPNPDVAVTCSGLHIHDSIVFVERSNVNRPVHSTVR